MFDLIHKDAALTDGAAALHFRRSSPDSKAASTSGEFSVAISLATTSIYFLHKLILMLKLFININLMSHFYSILHLYLQFSKKNPLLV